MPTSQDNFITNKEIDSLKKINKNDNLEQNEIFQKIFQEPINFYNLISFIEFTPNLAIRSHGKIVETLNKLSSEYQTYLVTHILKNKKLTETIWINNKNLFEEIYTHYPTLELAELLIQRTKKKTLLLKEESQTYNDIKNLKQKSFNWLRSKKKRGESLETFFNNQDNVNKNIAYLLYQSPKEIDLLSEKILENILGCITKSEHVTDFFILLLERRHKWITSFVKNNKKTLQSIYEPIGEKAEDDENIINKAANNLSNILFDGKYNEKLAQSLMKHPVISRIISNQQPTIFVRLSRLALNVKNFIKKHGDLINKNADKELKKKMGESEFYTKLKEAKTSDDFTALFHVLIRYQKKHFFVYKYLRLRGSPLFMAVGDAPGNEEGNSDFKEVVDNIRENIFSEERNELLALDLINNPNVCKFLCQGKPDNFIKLLKLTENPLEFITSLIDTVGKEKRDEALLKAFVYLANSKVNQFDDQANELLNQYFSVGLFASKRADVLIRESLRNSILALPSNDVITESPDILKTIETCVINESLANYFKFTEEELHKIILAKDLSLVCHKAISENETLYKKARSSFNEDDRVSFNQLNAFYQSKYLKKSFSEIILNGDDVEFNSLMSIGDEKIKEAFNISECDWKTKIANMNNTERRKVLANKFHNTLSYFVPFVEVKRGASSEQTLETKNSSHPSIKEGKKEEGQEEQEEQEEQEKMKKGFTEKQVEKENEHVDEETRKDQEKKVKQMEVKRRKEEEKRMEEEKQRQETQRLISIYKAFEPSEDIIKEELRTLTGNLMLNVFDYDGNSNENTDSRYEEEILPILGKYIEDIQTAMNEFDQSKIKQIDEQLKNEFELANNDKKIHISNFSWFKTIGIRHLKNVLKESLRRKYAEHTYAYLGYHQTFEMIHEAFNINSDEIEINHVLFEIWKIDQDKQNPQTANSAKSYNYFKEKTKRNVDKNEYMNLFKKFKAKEYFKQRKPFDEYAQYFWIIIQKIKQDVSIDELKIQTKDFFKNHNQSSNDVLKKINNEISEKIRKEKQKIANEKAQKLKINESKKMYAQFTQTISPLPFSFTKKIMSIFGYNPLKSQEQDDFKVNFSEFLFELASNMKDPSGAENRKQQRLNKGQRETKSESKVPSPPSPPASFLNSDNKNQEEYSVEKACKLFSEFNLNQYLKGDKKGEPLEDIMSNLFNLIKNKPQEKNTKTSAPQQSNREQPGLTHREAIKQKFANEKPKTIETVKEIERSSKKNKSKLDELIQSTFKELNTASNQKIIIDGINKIISAIWKNENVEFFDASKPFYDIEGLKKSEDFEQGLNAILAYLDELHKNKPSRITRSNSVQPTSSQQSCKGDRGKYQTILKQHSLFASAPNECQPQMTTTSFPNKKKIETMFKSNQRK